MNLIPLTEHSGQPYFEAIGSAPAIQDALRSLEEKKIAVRFIRGSRCATAPAFFSEAAAALQFPIHFGENWDAFADCFNDLKNIVVVILDAVHLLEKEPTSIETLGKILSASAKRHRDSAFNVVLHAETKDAAALSKAWPGTAKLA